MKTFNAFRNKHRILCHKLKFHIYFLYDFLQRHCRCDFQTVQVQICRNIFFNNHNQVSLEGHNLDVYLYLEDVKVSTDFSKKNITGRWLRRAHKMPARNGTVSTNVPGPICKIQNATGQRSFIPRTSRDGEDSVSPSLGERMQSGWRKESGVLHEERRGLFEEVGRRE